MKKPDIKILLLIACAAVAVFVCFMPNSVTVYTLPQENAEPVPPAYCSYFTLVEGVNWAITLPFAAVCACVCLMLAGIYAAVRKNGLLTVIKWLALGTGTLAIVPVLVKNPTVQMVPNVFVPIALLVQCAVAQYIAKSKEAPEQKKAAKRLK